jgi:hypothetical protein
MSVGDFSPMMQVQNNPSLTLTNVGTSASGTSTNGSNQVSGTINAFWFILGDAIVGYFYTNFKLSESGTVIFDLNWTSNWANGFNIPLKYYSFLNGPYQDAGSTSNRLIPHEGQGHLDFEGNGQWDLDSNKQSSALIVFKGDSQIGKKLSH